MTPAGICPPPESLLRLGADSLDADAFGSLESHLAACPACRERLESLARFDSTETGDGPRQDPPGTPPEIPGCVLGAELGRGGSGVVYEALQPKLGRRVAVKVLGGGPALDDRARGRWLREARAAARVRHPNIVRLHEAGEHDGRLYLILDLIPGGSLRRGAGAGRIPPREAARLIEAVARAVEAIHRAGLLHLDLKPANILLDGPPGADWSELTPLLSDFGVARDEADAAGGWEALGVRGTPAFMAPEQAAGRPGALGPAADVYALGATLYALLTNRPPSRGGRPIEDPGVPRSAGPTPPRALAPGLPLDLETIALTCLAKDPARRYASAADLADDLRRWLDGFPIRARPVSAAGRLARWCRRRPALAALAAALAATVLVALVGLTVLWRRSEHQRGRAEAALTRALEGEATADAAVADLVDLLRQAVDAPERSSSQRADDATAAVLALTAKLRRNPEIAARHAVAVAGLEMKLAEHRDRAGARDDSVRLLADAADLLAPGADAPPADAKIERAIRFAEVVVRRGQFLAQGPDAAEAEAEFLRVDRALAPHAGEFRALDSFVILHSSRAQLALWLREHGEPDAARRISRANAERFRELRDRTDDPIMGLLASLAVLEDETHGLSSATAAATDAAWLAYDRLPEGARVPQSLNTLLADLTACQLRSSAEAAADLRIAPDETARRLTVELDGRFAGRRLPRDFRDDVLDRLTHLGCSWAAEARRAGRVDEARRTTAWLDALARAVTARDPASVEARMMLSRALEQQAKDGWAADDREAVERSLRAALTEAAAAFDLAPDDEVCRRHLAGLREKYVRLAAAEPDR
ncbi:serine/threonine-protein kinase [Paludisphaera soli]|uniref:serine/threonine-protein kinase n=1 Tax=Paludisphaera soli TaxID=2712865 RepID=UPI0013EDFF1A|nr:serine/threonine-protein kinase [Paludisphaera soli]